MMPAARHDQTARRELTIRQRLSWRILELFHVEGRSTFAIADELFLTEAEVCSVLNEMERR
jgi:hypothetical protein